MCTVYELPGTDRALKLGSPAHNDVWRDFLAINTAYVAFVVSEFSFKLVRDFFKNDVSIPRVPRRFEFHTDKDATFCRNLTNRLPIDKRASRGGLIMERIHPLWKKYNEP